MQRRGSQYKARKKVSEEQVPRAKGAHLCAPFEARRAGAVWRGSTVGQERSPLPSDRLLLSGGHVWQKPEGREPGRGHRRPASGPRAGQRRVGEGSEEAEPTARRPPAHPARQTSRSAFGTWTRPGLDERPSSSSFPAAPLNAVQSFAFFLPFLLSSESRLSC